MRFIIGIVVAAAFNYPATALDGNQLFKTCALDDDVNKALCTSYIGGAIDGIAFMSNDPGATQVFCVLPNVDGRQAQDVVKKFLADNPAARSSPASWSVARALHDAWPCPEKGPRPEAPK